MSLPEAAALQIGYLRPCWPPSRTASAVRCPTRYLHHPRRAASPSELALFAARVAFSMLLLLLSPQAGATPFNVDPDQWAAIGEVARDVHGVDVHYGAKLTRVCPMALAEHPRDECHAVRCYSKSSCRTLQNDDVSSLEVAADASLACRASRPAVWRPSWSVVVTQPQHQERR
jgi:hypothetical protein